MTFNPDSLCTLGLQWFTPKESNTRLDGSQAAAGALIVPATTDTVDALWVGVTALSGPGAWEVEIYDMDALALGTPATVSTIVRPTADAAGTNFGMKGWDQVLSPSISPPTSVNLFRFIDNATLTPGTFPSGVPVDDNSLIFPVFGRSAEATYRFGSLNGVTASKLITKVTLEARVQEFIDIAFVEAMTITPFLIIDGIKYDGASQTFSRKKGGGHKLAHTWEFDPSTGCSWRPDSVDKFDTVVGPSSAGWRIEPTGSSNNLATVMQGWLEVEYEDGVEPRVAVGCLDEPIFGWNRIELLDTETGAAAAWTKTSGTTYLIVLRRRSGSGYIGWRYLESEEAAPHVWTFQDIIVRPDKRVQSNANGVLGKGYAIAIEDNGGLIVTDSQSYLSINNDGGPAIGFFNEWIEVDTTVSLEQEFTPGANDDFGFIRALIRQAVEEPDGSLTIKIKRRSDNVQFGTTVTITTADLVQPKKGDDELGWQIIEKQMGTPGTLVSGTQYYFHIESAATAGNGWNLQVASTLLTTIDVDGVGEPPATIGEGTFGGIVEQLTHDVTQYQELDAEITISNLPTAPTNFAAVELTTAHECVNAVRLTWTETDVVAEGCGAFLQYEIERSDDLGVTYDTIAVITAESVEQFDDYESLRNAVATYRMRVRRADRSLSVATATATATATMTCCGYMFTSNEAPDLSVWYDDLRPREYQFLENVEYVQFHDRKFGVEYHELEERGLRFSADLVIGSEGGVSPCGPVATDGVIAFDDLLNAVRPARGATLSYVCVHAQEGDRWFASVRTPSGVRDEPGGQYTASVTVTEVTDTPSTPDVEGS